MIKKISCIFSICLTGFHILSVPVHAGSVNNYAIRPVLPENQTDQDQTYFDLKLSKGKTQTIQIIIDNSEEEDILVNVALNNASTARNGLIVYHIPDIKDKNMPLSITDIAQVTEPEVLIPAGSFTTVDIEIKMPSQSFDGILLGGIVTTARKISEPPPSPSSGTALTNEYIYVTALKIRQNDIPVKPDFEFISITPELINHHNAVTVNLRNTAPSIAKEITLNADIYKENYTSIFYSLQLTNAEMAPSSTGEFAIDWENTTLEPGSYKLHLTLQHNGKEWSWKEPFTISETQAAQTNAKAVNLPTTPAPKYALAITAIILVILIDCLAIRRITRNQI